MTVGCHQNSLRVDPPHHKSFKSELVHFYRKEAGHHLWRYLLKDTLKGSLAFCWQENRVSDTFNTAQGRGRDHSFSTYAKFSAKLTFLTHTRTCTYQGVRNITFLENLAYVSIELSFINSLNS